MPKIQLEFATATPATATKTGTINVNNFFFLTIDIPPSALDSLNVVYTILHKIAIFLTIFFKIIWKIFLHLNSILKSAEQ